MSLKELFEILPQLLNLFVPGFVFLTIYKYLASTKDKDFNVTIIGSFVLSYIFQLIVSLICRIVNVSASGNIVTVIAIILAIICALIIVKVRLTACYKKITTWIGRTTGSKNIWYDLFDLNKGTRIRFFTKYNNEDVIVEGDVKYYEECEDGDCNIVISNYKIKYIVNGNVYKNNTPNATMIFNSKNIHGLEAHYGK
ncbi:MAG: hypothetical protein E7481_04890 [Ruminococcaceae bacterium]|nr:hypothetical protein [Oscillospiraceae bacterium]